MLNIIGPLVLGAGVQLATDDDTPLGQRELLADLRDNIPPGLLQGRGDAFGADIAFGEVFLVHLGQILRQDKDLRSYFGYFGLKSVSRQAFTFVNKFHILPFYRSNWNFI